MFICRIDGRDLRRLSQEPGDQVQPAYSRSLHRVFYVRPIEKRAQICSVDHEGRDFRLEVDLKARAHYPDVSPDGKTLLFSTDMWGAFELAEMNLENREITRLTYDQGINTCPQYSPDGRSILFLSRRNGLAEVYLMERESGDLTRVTDSPFAQGAPTWNPTATRFITTEARPPKFRSVLLEEELGTKTSRYLLPQSKGVTKPRYSRDGSLILFIEESTLYTYDPSDTAAQPFPIRGNLLPEDAIWVEFPLP